MPCHVYRQSRGRSCRVCASTRNEIHEVKEDNVRKETAPELVRRLSRAATFSFVRGAATAAGSGLVAVLIWWIQNR